MKLTNLIPARHAVLLALAATAMACSADRGSDAAITVAAPNSVTDAGRTVELRPTWTGQATSFGQRGDDDYRVGYFVKDGTALAVNSLLIDEDTSMSSLELNTVADGLAFSAVVAHGAGTDLSLTGSIASTDDGDGQMVSDFSGLGAMVIVSDGARGNDGLDGYPDRRVRALGCNLR